MKPQLKCVQCIYRSNYDMKLEICIHVNEISDDDDDDGCMRENDIRRVTDRSVIAGVKHDDAEVLLFVPVSDNLFVFLYIEVMNKRNSLTHT